MTIGDVPPRAPSGLLVETGSGAEVDLGRDRGCESTPLDMVRQSGSDLAAAFCSCNLLRSRMRDDWPAAGFVDSKLR